MTSLRIQAVRRAGRLVRPARSCVASGVAAALLLSPAPLFAQSAGFPGGATPRAVLPDGASVAGLATSSAAMPLWLRPGQEQAAADLVALMAASRLDGLDPSRYRIKELQRALRAAWGGSPLAVQRAERLLSQAFVDYVRDLRQAPDLGIIYVDPQLRPQALEPRAILEGAARQADLVRYVHTMGWMHPYYAPLRDALTSGGYDRQQRETLLLNLERARALPGADAGRYVLMNAAQQRLFVMEDGKVVDTMRVVVGKPGQPTPMMAALIRYTSLNPYWNVPPDLVAERIAPFVLKEGMGFLKAKGYQVLSNWGDRPEVVDPRSVDWEAVAAGTKEIRVRQLPGPANSMGAMKFMFPNPQGIYLHDTPSTELFSEASRLFSGGCVRLEAAPRLAAWLYNGRAPRAQGATPEQKVVLDQPVPVYLTYLTAVPSGSAIAFYQDIYGRDASRLAELGRPPALASRR